MTISVIILTGGGLIRLLHLPWFILWLRKVGKQFKEHIAAKRGEWMIISKSILYFILAGLCEIGGGWLVWQWLRNGKSVWLAVLGAVFLVLYGVIPTFQPTHFGRVYAAYGGVFIVMALFWGWSVDKIAPDRIDLIGACIALTGVGIMMYWPRTIG